MEVLHEILLELTEGIILLFEYVGVLVMLWTGIKGIINYFRKCPLTRINMSSGMAMALNFLLVGEILHTVAVSDEKDLLMVGGLIVLRVALTLLIHWEFTSEKKEFEEELKNSNQENEIMGNQKSA